MLQNILTEPNPAFTSICTFDISKLEYVLITYNKSCLQGHSNGFCKHGPIRLKLIWIKELERPGFNEIDILFEIFHYYVIKKRRHAIMHIKSNVIFHA